MTEENKGIILYAEDDPDMRGHIGEILKRNFPAFDTELFEDGTSLESRLNDGIANVRLVITDNNMPGIRGSEIIDKYAQVGSFNHIPFILFYFGDKSTGEFLASKYDNVSYLLKQGELQSFEELIRESLDYPERKLTESSQ